MNLERFSNLHKCPKFIELWLLMILLLGVTIYVVMPAYTGFRDFLACTIQSGSLLGYGTTVH